MNLKLIALVLIIAVLLTLAIGYYLDNQSSGKEKHYSSSGENLQADNNSLTTNGLYSPSPEKDSSTKDSTLSSKITTTPKKEEKGKSPYTAYHHGGSSDSDNSGSGSSNPPIIDIINVENITPDKTVDSCIVNGPPPTIPESLFGG